MKIYECRICQSADVAWKAEFAESMYLNGETFEYWSCGHCRCLQITACPSEMAAYYPTDYYSFELSKRGIKEVVRDWLTLNGPSALFKGRGWFDRGEYRAISDINKNARILDVGCGNGSLIRTLRELGFQNLTGIDPFMGPELLSYSGVNFKRTELTDLAGEFDVILMNHSLEHMWDQRGTVRKVLELLSARGKVIIRIPTIDSWAFKKFSGSWSQLDPPRHFYLHSRSSIRLLLQEAGLVIDRIVDDAGPFGIIGSMHSVAGRSSLSSEALPSSELRVALRQVKMLNETGEGDQIAVHASRAAI